MSLPAGRSYIGEAFAAVLTTSRLRAIAAAVSGVKIMSAVIISLHGLEEGIVRLLKLPVSPRVVGHHAIRIHVRHASGGGRRRIGQGRQMRRRAVGATDQIGRRQLIIAGRRGLNIGNGPRIIYAAGNGSVSTAGAVNSH